MLVTSVKKYPLLPVDKVIEFKNKHEKVISDKNDLVILLTAFEAKVDAIITGDKHFDSVEVRKLIEIMDTNQALEKIKFQ